MDETVGVCIECLGHEEWYVACYFPCLPRIPEIHERLGRDRDGSCEPEVVPPDRGPPVGMSDDAEDFRNEALGEGLCWATKKEWFEAICDADPRSFAGWDAALEVMGMMERAGMQCRAVFWFCP